MTNNIGFILVPGVYMWILRVVLSALIDIVHKTDDDLDETADLRVADFFSDKIK